MSVGPTKRGWQRECNAALPTTAEEAAQLPPKNPADATRREEPRYPVANP